MVDRRVSPLTARSQMGVVVWGRALTDFRGRKCELLPEPLPSRPPGDAPGRLPAEARIRRVRVARRTGGYAVIQRKIRRRRPRMGGSDAATLVPAVTDGSLNILYMVLEDFRALSMSAYCGSISSPSRPCASTPRLDGLVKEGVLFEHAFAQSPICNPSRTSMMTGRHPSTTGCSAMMTIHSCGGLPNLPRLLQRHAAS